ncbi:hypothetical protein VNI00_008838 [Paramarasmius palmivorus]|uniref:Glycoside hydrolase family 76 protein n=1 Tax=Paramarasmius palmivorus TaxID=297713 RepID=A0AAW0CP87_9AGAR
MICLAVLWRVVNSAVTPIAIPPSWRKPTINLTMEERIDFAAEALDKAYTEPIPSKQSDPMELNKHSFGIPEDHDVDLHTLLIEFDIAVNQTRYKDKVSHYFANVPSSKYKSNGVYAAHLDLQDAWLTLRSLDPFYGYAAALAHVAYKPEDRIFLDIATEIWDSNNNRVLSRSGLPFVVFQNTSNARVKLIGDTLVEHKKCQNSVDLSGGLIHDPTLGNMVTSENARFFRLSGVLAEITGDTQYLNAAQQSAKLFLSRLYTNDSLFWWAVKVDTNNPCETLVEERKEPWNAGLTGSIVASSNHPEWHDPSGQGIMMLNNKQDSAAALVRGLATVLARKESFNSSLSTYVEAYLAVQYSALLDLATVTGTNMYGNSWIGPPNMTYSATDQFSAARVLIAGININSQLESQSPPEPSAAGTSATGGIVGGVVGGLSLIALVVLGSLFIIRRRHHNSTDTRVIPENPLIPIPYVLQLEKHRRKRRIDGSISQGEPPAEAPPPAYSE